MTCHPIRAKRNDRTTSCDGIGKSESESILFKGVRGLTCFSDRSLPVSYALEYVYLIH